MKNHLKTFAPLLLAVVFGIGCGIYAHEFVVWENMTLLYGSSALILLPFAGICAFTGKSKKGIIGKFFAGLVGSAAILFGLTVVVNNIIFKGNKSNVAIAIILSLLVCIAAVIMAAHYSSAFKNRKVGSFGAALSIISALFGVAALWTNALSEARQFLFKTVTPLALAFINLFNLGAGEIKQTTAEINGSLVCTDALGRSITSTGNESEKLVGVFYFLWMGQHSDCSPAIFDNTKILAANPDAIKSEQSWFAAGGGDVGDFHYWSEPLFGYYRSDDEWVIRKHAQMLTDAGVDFIFFDTTNPGLYLNVVEKIIGVWHEYYLEGWDVPKMLFYTNTNSGRNINTLHDDIYNNAELLAKYPKLDELWLYMDGKPLIIGRKYDAALRDDVKDYFRIKATQWPYEAKEDDGFPWMEFNQRALTLDSVYNYNGTSMMSVSAAQHTDGDLSRTAWYGGNSRTRSWHNGANDTSEDALLYGYNFAEQWEFALDMNTDIVLVTGFNEWVAQRQPVTEDEPIHFVDNADENCSRDVEPAKGRLGDNYYLQMVDYISKYKGNVSSVSRASGVSIDINGDFNQWENEKIAAKYRDYENDTADRNCYNSANDFLYTDTSGRNDIVNIKVTDDSENYYFYVETAENLTPSTDKNWMSLFINESYVVNRTSPENGITSVEKITDSGYERIGEAQIKFEGNKLMLKLPKALIEDSEALNFKWADNYVENDVYSFYTNGDSAPYGRMCYSY